MTAEPGTDLRLRQGRVRACDFPFRGPAGQTLPRLLTAAASRSVLITGGGASFAGLMAFGTAHALSRPDLGAAAGRSAIRAGGRRHPRVRVRPRGAHDDAGVG